MLLNAPCVTDLIASADPATRDLALDQWCAGRPTADLLAACTELDA